MEHTGTATDDSDSEETDSQLLESSAQSPPSASESSRDHHQPLLVPLRRDGRDNVIGRGTRKDERVDYRDVDRCDFCREPFDAYRRRDGVYVVPCSHCTEEVGHHRDTDFWRRFGHGMKHLNYRERLKSRLQAAIGFVHWAGMMVLCALPTVGCALMHARHDWVLKWLARHGVSALARSFAIATCLTLAVLCFYIRSTEQRGDDDHHERRRGKRLYHTYAIPYKFLTMMALFCFGGFMVFVHRFPVPEAPVVTLAFDVVVAYALVSAATTFDLPHSGHERDRVKLSTIMWRDPAFIKLGLACIGAFAFYGPRLAHALSISVPDAFVGARMAALVMCCGLCSLSLITLVPEVGDGVGVLLFLLTGMVTLSIYVTHSFAHYSYDWELKAVALWNALFFFVVRISHD